MGNREGSVSVSLGSAGLRLSRGALRLGTYESGSVLRNVVLSQGLWEHAGLGCPACGCKR